MAAKKILVVEDDAGVSRVLRMALAAGGFEVKSVTTGGGALDVLNSAPSEDGVDAVALDLRLADGRGAHVLRWLRSKNHDAPVWVVMSSLDQQEATREFGPLGDNYLPKPFDPWNLVNMLKKLLDKADTK